jgi:hypothetical protein
MPHMKRRSTIQRFLATALLALLSFPLVACSHLVARSNAGISSPEEDAGAL